MSESFKVKAKNVLSSVLYITFSYSTIRQATIHSKKIGIVFRTLQLAIIAYIIGYFFENLIYNH